MEQQTNQPRLQSAEVRSQLPPSLDNRKKELYPRPDGGPPVLAEEQSRRRHAHGNTEPTPAAFSKPPRPTQQPRDEQLQEAERGIEVDRESSTDADRVNLSKSPATQAFSRAEHARAVELAIRVEVDKTDLTLSERETVMNRVHENIAKSTRRDRIATHQPYEPRDDFQRIKENKDRELDR